MLWKRNFICIYNIFNIKGELQYAVIATIGIKNHEDFQDKFHINLYSYYS